MTSHIGSPILGVDREGAEGMNIVTFKEVGYNIQQLLKERSMTQQALADVMGISKQVMSKIVSGAKAINVAEISRIASALGTTVDRLLVPVSRTTEVEAFSFMGKIKNDRTREKITVLNEVIREILLLEEITEAN